MEYRMEYYSVLRKKEILACTTTWKNTTDTIGEINQSRKDKYCIIILEVSKVVKFIKKPSRKVVTREWSKGKGGVFV